MMLKWLFPKKNRNKIDKNCDISQDASQFLYHVWRKISESKPYNYTSIMIHVKHTHYDHIRTEVERFLTDRGYTISYFEGICNKIEIIIHW